MPLLRFGSEDLISDRGSLYQPYAEMVCICNADIDYINCSIFGVINMISIKRAVSIICVIMIAIMITGCNCSNGAPKATEDEIQLKISLDLKEDIGLLVIDHQLDGVKGSGGMSNADKSMIKHNDVLYWTFCKKDHEKVTDPVELTIVFTVVTEYCEPNYENIYPEELMIPLEPVSFMAEFCRTYEIVITGSKSDGYKAVLSGRQ